MWLMKQYRLYFLALIVSLFGKCTIHHFNDNVKNRILCFMFSPRSQLTRMSSLY